MQNMKKLVAAAAFFITSSAAHATVQWVDLLDDPNNLAEGAYSSLVFDDFTVTAGGYRGFTGTAYDVYVDRTSIHGLGVDTTDAFIAEEPNVDGNDRDDIDGRNDESLIFTFGSGLWRLVGITFVDGDHDLDFSSSSPDDEFDLFVDASEILTDVPIEANDINGEVDLTTLASLGALVGNVFQIGADTCGFGDNTSLCHDSFYIHKIHYERVAVPEPATLGMVGLALTGLGFGFARRRSA